MERLSHTYEHFQYTSCKRSRCRCRCCRFFDGVIAEALPGTDYGDFVAQKFVKVKTPGEYRSLAKKILANAPVESKEIFLDI